MPPTFDIVRCDYKKKEHYDAQGEFCKPCDKCPKGWGEVDFDDKKFEIDLRYGALGCLHCVKCRNGTYSSSFSYGQCQPCYNCQNEGRYTERECSSTQNTVCGGKIPATTSRGSSQSSSTTEGVAVVLGSFIGGLVFAVFLIVILVVIYRRRRKSKHRKQKSSKTKNDKGKDNISEMTEFISSIETVSSVRTKVSDSGIETDGSLANIAEVHLKPDKIETWKKSHDCSEILSSKHAQMISEKIAVCNYYRWIGIHLGLTDNDIDVIVTDHKGCQTHAYETLRKWKEVKGSHATVGTLLEALQYYNLCDIAEYFCNKYECDKVGNMQTCT